MLTLAGPALIVASLLVVLWDTAAAGLITRVHGDVGSFWLPTHCYLGESLRAGTIPAWNPAVFSGTPFAADPQSGWMFLLPMVLYGGLPCGIAAPALLVLTPMIGALGLYLFLRSEGLSRSAATSGGLILGLGFAGSKLGLSFPFVSTLALAALALWAASRLLHASAWSSRLAWVMVTGLLWGQIVAAHGSQGQIVGTAILAAFLLTRITSDVVRHRRRLRPALGLGALLLVAVVAINLAVLLPRVVVLPRISTSLGNQTLDQLSRETGAEEGQRFRYREGKAAEPAWPLKLGLSQGAHVGIAGLILATAAVWTRRHRALVVGIGLYGLVTYSMSLRMVADWVAERFGGSTLLDVLYLHQPWRLAIGSVLALAVLAATGFDAWRDRGWPVRAAMFVPGVLLWIGVPSVLRVDMGLFVPGLLVALGVLLVLLVANRFPVVAGVVALLIAIDLGGNVLAGYDLEERGEALGSNEFGLGIMPPGLNAIGRADLDASAYVRPTSFVEALRMSPEPARYVLATRYRGLLSDDDWAALGAQRAMIFGLEAVDGYNPYQLKRFWLTSRRVNTEPQKYNLTSFPEAPDHALDVFGVTHVIARKRSMPRRDWELLATEGDWALYRRTDAPTRAQLFDRWTVVGSEEAALEAVADPTFDPRSSIVLERAPDVDGGQSPDPGEAVYRWDGTQAAEIRVHANAPGMLLVRNAYDTGWKATVDGRPVPAVPANVVSIAVPVPAGDHVVRLEYREGSIIGGLIGSVLAIVSFSGAAFWLRRRERLKSREDSGSSIAITRSPAVAAQRG